MKTKLDYNRDDYNVVVRSERVSPHYNPVEVLFTPINKSVLVFDNVTRLKDNDLVMKLRMGIEINASMNKLIFRFSGDVLPEYITDLEKAVMYNRVITREIVKDVQKD